MLGAGADIISMFFTCTQAIPVEPHRATSDKNLFFKMVEEMAAYQQRAQVTSQATSVQKPFLQDG